MNTLQNIYELFQQCQQKICIDTRNITPHAIFFALKGNRFDGNLFAIDAIQKGCHYAIVDNPDIASKSDKCILVNNVLKTLQNLAEYHRLQMPAKIIGITGSNGKTTTKELIAKVLSEKYNVWFTPGNFNNHIGLPLTLLQLKKEHEIAVIEMGANHPGEIAELCKIAHPDFAIITSIGKEHLEGFNNLETIKKTNGELYEYVLNKNGTIFLHIDNPDLLDILQSFQINYNTIIQNKNFIIYTDLTHSPTTTSPISNAIAGQYIENNQNIFVELKWIRLHQEHFQQKPIIKTKLLAFHNYINALCAICVGNYFEIPEQNINTAISNYIPDKNRMQWIVTPKNNKIILDAYNANPTSMLASLNFFKEKNISTPSHSSPNKVLILGDMFELGEYAEKEHKDIIHWLKNNFPDEPIFLVGKEFSNAAHQVPISTHSHIFQNTQELLTYLSQNNHTLTNKFILIKASRGMQLEKTLQYL